MAAKITARAIPRGAPSLVPAPNEMAGIIPIDNVRHFLRDTVSANETVLLLTWGTNESARLYSELSQAKGQLRDSAKAPRKVFVQDASLTGLEQWFSGLGLSKVSFSNLFLLDQRKYFKISRCVESNICHSQVLNAYRNCLCDLAVVSRLEGLLTRTFSSWEERSQEATDTRDNERLGGGPGVSSMMRRWLRVSTENYKRFAHTSGGIYKFLATDGQKVLDAGASLSGGGYSSKKLLSLVWARSPPTLAQALKIREPGLDVPRNLQLRNNSYVLDRLDSVYQPLVHRDFIQPFAQHVLLTTPLYNYPLFRQFARRLTIKVDKVDGSPSTSPAISEHELWASDHHIYAVTDPSLTDSTTENTKITDWLGSEFYNGPTLAKQLQLNAAQKFSY